MIGERLELNKFGQHESTWGSWMWEVEKRKDKKEFFWVCLTITNILWNTCVFAFYSPSIRLNEIILKSRNLFVGKINN